MAPNDEVIGKETPSTESHDSPPSTTLMHHLHCLTLQEMVHTVTSVVPTASPSACSRLPSPTRSIKRISNMTLPSSRAISKNSSGNTCKPSTVTMMTTPSLLLNLAMPITCSQAMITEEEIVDQLCIHELSTSNACQSSLSISLDTVVDSSNQSQKTIPLHPIMFLTPALIQNEPCKKFLSALLDTGSDISLIYQRCLPVGIKPTKVEPRSVVGLHQACQYEHEVMLQDIVLPELSPSKSITQFSFMVSTHDSSPGTWYSTPRLPGSEKRVALSACYSATALQLYHGTRASYVLRRN